MATVKIITEENKALFNRLATHPLQSWAWGEFRQLQEHQVWRLGLFEASKLTQVFQVTFHRVPKTPFTIGYLPKSLLPTLEVIEELKKIGQLEKAIFIKIEPNEVRVRPARIATQGVAGGDRVRVNTLLLSTSPNLKKSFCKALNPKPVTIFAWPKNMVLLFKKIILTKLLKNI